MVNASKLDDIFFALSKASDEIAGAMTSAAIKATKTIDPTSYISSMAKGSFFKNVNLPDIPLQTSKLFHTTEMLSGLKKIDATDLISGNTTDLITSLGKKVDDLPAGQIDDFATTFAKMDTPDSDILDNLVETSSISKIKNLTGDLAASSANKLDDIVTNKSTYKYTEDIATTGAKKTDDLADSLKASTKVSGKTDEVADVAGATGKKADSLLDDAVGAADNTDAMKLYKKLDAWSGKINFAIMGAYMLSLHIKGEAPWSQQDAQEYFEGPILPEEVDELSLKLDAQEMVSLVSASEEEENTALNSNAVAIGLVVASIAFMIV